MAIRGNSNPEAYYTEANFVELVDPSNRSTGVKIFVKKTEVTTYEKINENRDKDFNCSYVSKQIFSLKNSGLLNSHYNRSAPFSRMLSLEGGQLVYVHWRGSVYIEELRIQTDYKIEKNKRTVAAGVYKAKLKEGKKNEWAVGEDETAKSLSQINTKNLAINGHCRDIGDAANFMPNFIRHGFGEGALNGTYTLFFNPSQGFVHGDWQALRDSSGISGTQASKKLAEVLSLTAAKNMEVNLTVHESGHALLKEALRVVCKDNIKLDQFTVFYANPTHNLELVDVWRKRTGMKLAAKPPLLNTCSPHQFMLTGNAISFPVVACQADSGNAVATVYNSVGSITSAAGLGAIASAAGLTAGWVFAVAPYIFGGGRSGNQEVIEGPGQAVQHGTKLVWNSVHKMMIKG